MAIFDELHVEARKVEWEYTNDVLEINKSGRVKVMKVESCKTNLEAMKGGGGFHQMNTNIKELHSTECIIELEHLY